MQLDEKTFLEMAEKTGELVFFDIESYSLSPDYGSMLVFSALPYNATKATTFAVTTKGVGNDRKVVREATEYLNEKACWVSFYGKMFDVPFIRSRLLKWNMDLELIKKHHIDLYWVIRANVNPARKSQAHLLDWLKVDTRKMSVSADDWSEVGQKPSSIRVLKQRCESDVFGLRDLYKRTKMFVRNIQR